MLTIKNSARIKFFCLALVLLQASCSSMPHPEPSETRVTGEGVLSVGSRHTATESLSGDNSLEGRADPQLFRGSGKLLNMPKARPAIELEGDEVMLNFVKVPLEDVVHGVLGDILQLDYMIEGNITGEVTLSTHMPIGREELLSIVESMLQANGVALLRGENDRFVITTTQAATARMPRFVAPGSGGAGFGNVIVPLQYIGAAQMAEILQPVAPETAFVRVDPMRNILILAGTGAQQDAWLEIIETFDVDLLSGMSVAIFPIEHSSIDEVHKALDLLLANASGEQGSLMGGLIRFIPLESLGSVLVVTPRESYIEQVKTWIERLDRAPEMGAEAQLFVYPVQNGSASHLAQMLSSLFGGSSMGGSQTNSGQRNDGVSPGLTPTNLSSSDTGQNQARGAQSGSNRAGRSSSGSSFSLGESIKVVADEVNNALLVHSTGFEYRKILSVLEKLDVVPLQVLIEASILEVTLSDELEYGLEWYLDNSLGNGWRGRLNVGGSSNMGIPGFGYAFNNPLGDLRAVLNTIATKNLLRVVSTPSIMVLDNHSAAIHVGDQQPIRTSSTVFENTGSVTSSISYRDTGVKLNVTPSVNAGGLVTMDLEQSVTDIGEIDVATGSAAFFERNIMSRVAVRSGEAVVLGGLIRDNQTRGKTGLPFFQDLPIIGALFGSTNRSERRTELIVIITPHVIKNDQDMRDVTSEMRARMKGLKVFEEHHEE